MTPEQRIDEALETILKASGSSLRYYETVSKDKMREAMRKIMSDAYIQGSNALAEIIKQ